MVLLFLTRFRYTCIPELFICWVTVCQLLQVLVTSSSKWDIMKGSLHKQNLHCCCCSCYQIQLEEMERDYITQGGEASAIGCHLREMSLLQGMVRPLLELEMPLHLGVGRLSLLVKKTSTSSQRYHVSSFCRIFQYIPTLIHRISFFSCQYPWFNVPWVHVHFEARAFTFIVTHLIAGEGPELDFHCYQHYNRGK